MRLRGQSLAEPPPPVQQPQPAGHVLDQPPPLVVAALADALRHEARAAAQQGQVNAAAGERGGEVGGGRAGVGGHEFVKVLQGAPQVGLGVGVGALAGRRLGGV
jgi:hypothetical protein